MRAIGGVDIVAGHRELLRMFLTKAFEFGGVVGVEGADDVAVVGCLGLRAELGVERGVWGCWGGVS